ncbi:lipase (class 3) domain-containing protein [Purpureocillium lavendulum]|uniref:Lipase (Class 3) domain-containing protein n=1 Tax=Purpureocillium lavendulum TaxID=1247861 RepID=A0AB34G366_9HYPO|nr:lipase (class 3) domain-containing protein [Purpureocillium lavendulum]
MHLSEIHQRTVFFIVMLCVKPLLCLLGSLASVAGYSLPGGYERMMFYYAYLMDCDSNGGAAKIIAPGCAKAAGHAAGTKCTLRQFINYIAKTKPSKTNIAQVPEGDGDDVVPTVATAEKLVQLELTGAVNLGLVNSHVKQGETYDVLLSKTGEFLAGKMASDKVRSQVKDLAHVALRSVLKSRMEAATDSFKQANGGDLVVELKDMELDPEDRVKILDVKKTAQASGRTDREVMRLFAAHLEGGHKANINTLRGCFDQSRTMRECMRLGRKRALDDACARGIRDGDVDGWRIFQDQGHDGGANVGNDDGVGVGVGGVDKNRGSGGKEDKRCRNKSFFGSKKDQARDKKRKEFRRRGVGPYAVVDTGLLHCGQDPRCVVQPAVAGQHAVACAAAHRVALPDVGAKGAHCILADGAADVQAELLGACEQAAGKVAVHGVVFAPSLDQHVRVRGDAMFVEHGVEKCLVTRVNGRAEDGRPHGGQSPSELRGVVVYAADKAAGFLVNNDGPSEAGVAVYVAVEGRGEDEHVLVAGRHFGTGVLLGLIWNRRLVDVHIFSDIEHVGREPSLRKHVQIKQVIVVVTRLLRPGVSDTRATLFPSAWFFEALLDK